MKHVITALLLLFLWAAGGTAEALEAGKLQQITDYVEGERRAARIPGMALGIVENGTVIYTAGFGSAGADAGAVTPQTPFIIGSLSKSVTALAVMQLVEAGKLQLHDPVEAYLSLADIGLTKSAPQLTVQSLLTQTSGIGGAAAGELGSPVFRYADRNYELLGRIVSRVSGLSYEEYVQKFIFSPLRMTHSFADEGTARQNGLAAGYRSYFGVRVAQHVLVAAEAVPAGYIAASAADMARYVAAYMNGGVYDGQRVLSEAGVAQLQQPFVKDGLLGEDSFYGMGWFIVPTHGVMTFKHSGEVANYRANMLMMPEQRYGFVLLANTNDAVVTSRLVEQMSDSIAAILVDKKPKTAGNTYWQTFLALDAVLLLIAVLACLPLVQLRIWYVKFKSEKSRLSRSAIVVLLLQLIAPLLLLAGVPLVTGFSWSFLFSFAPDICTVLIGTAVVVLLAGLLKAGCFLTVSAWRRNIQKQR